MKNSHAQSEVYNLIFQSLVHILTIKIKTYYYLNGNKTTKYYANRKKGRNVDVQ